MVASCHAKEYALLRVTLNFDNTFRGKMVGMWVYRISPIKGHRYKLHNNRSFGKIPYALFSCWPSHYIMMKGRDGEGEGSWWCVVVLERKEEAKSRGRGGEELERMLKWLAVNTTKTTLKRLSLKLLTQHNPLSWSAKNFDNLVTKEKLKPVNGLA